MPCEAQEQGGNKQDNHHTVKCSHPLPKSASAWSLLSMRKVCAFTTVEDHIAGWGPPDKNDSYDQSETRSVADSESRLANNKVTRSRGVWFPSTNSLAYALLAVTVAVVTFF